MSTSTSGLMLMLGIPAIALLWLIFRSSARPGAVGAEKWVPRAIGGFGVFMALSAGIFIGSMVPFSSKTFLLI